MKKISLTSVCALVLSLFAGQVVAQTQYCGETITHLNSGNESDAVSLTIEKTGDLTARVTIEPLGDKVLDFMQIQVSGLPTQDVSTLTGNTMVADLVFSAAPESITITALLWSFTDFDGNWMVQNLDAAFGTCGGSGEDDTEAPEALQLISAVPSSSSVTFVVKATDNSGRVSYTAKVGDVETTVTGMSDAETNLTVSGLSPETSYDYTITVADAAGNQCTTVLTGNITTTQSNVTVWNGAISPADYVQGGDVFAPAITYSITCNDDRTLTMDMQLSSDKDGLVVEVNFGTPDAYLGAVSSGDLNFSVTTNVTYETGQVLEGFFWIKYAGGVSRANFSYTVGAENDPVTPEIDTEAPVISKADYKACTHNTVTVTFFVTDNLSPSVSLEVSGDNFATLLSTVDNVACGTEVDCTITGLQPETQYDLCIRAKDVSGNVSNPFSMLRFTTDAAPSWDETEYNGYIDNEDLWNEKNRPDGWTEVFAPTIYYTITTTVDNQLKFDLKLMQSCPGLIAEAYVDGAYTALASVGENEYEGVTAATYERGSTVSVYFRFPYASSVSSTKPFDFVVGSKASLPSGLDRTASAGTRVFVANGTICIEGATPGSGIAVYDITGKSVYLSHANTGRTTVVPAVHGIYIVKIDDVKYKVVL